MRRVISCLLAAGLSGGCFSYVQAPNGGPPVGREVRVTLTDAGSLSAAATVGPRVVALNGRLTASTDSALTLAVTSTVKRNGVEDPWNGESVSVRREYVARTEERRLSRGRTVAAGALLAALGGAFTAVLGGGNGGSGLPRRPPGGGG